MHHIDQKSFAGVLNWGRGNGNSLGVGALAGHEGTGYGAWRIGGGGWLAVKALAGHEGTGYETK